MKIFESMLAHGAVIWNENRKGNEKKKDALVKFLGDWE